MNAAEVPTPEALMVDHALACAARGCRVIPCSPDTKQPLTPKESAPGRKDGGFHLATTDEEQIRRWWRMSPNAMIGIATGSGVGAWVLDLDARRAGMTSGALLAQLCQRIGRKLPPTWMAETPGGLHLYFRSPAMLNGEQVRIGNRSGIIEHVDVRGDEVGYVIAPGSIRRGPQAIKEGVDGVAYTWAEDAGPDDLDLADAPEELLALVIGKREPEAAPATPLSAPMSPRLAVSGESVDEARRKYALTALDRESRKVARAPKGQRNAILNNAALAGGSLVATGYLSEPMVIAALEAAAAECGLSQDDGIAATRATIRSGLNAGKANPRDMSGVGISAGHAEEQKRLGASAALHIVGKDGDGAPTEAHPERTSPKLMTAKEFVDALHPPEYLIEDIAQFAYLYSLTAPTGHGKTAVALRLAFSVALGLPVGSRRVEQGRVLFLAGENPDDVRARILVMAVQMGVDLDALPIFVVEGVFDLKDTFNVVRAQIEEIGPFSMIIVDTLAAYFQGDDDNSNVQMGDYARTQLRLLTTLPGRPAVIVPAHPTKGATRESLAPRGGGALLNEVDGNLRLWSNGEGVTELHWHGKLRGPIFEPIQFALDPVTHDCLKDSKGRLMPTVMARALTEEESEKLRSGLRRDEDGVLDAINEFPNGSLAEWCRFLGWVRPTGDEQKSKIQRRLQSLERDKLVRKVRDRWILTTTGEEEAKRSSTGKRAARNIIASAEANDDAGPDDAGYMDAGEFNKRHHGHAWATKKTRKSAPKSAGRQ